MGMGASMASMHCLLRWVGLELHYLGQSWVDSAVWVWEFFLV
jgi:hypothetical protein